MPTKKAKKSRPSPYTLDQKRTIIKWAREVFDDRFKGKPEPQTKFGLALKISQSSASALMRGDYTPSIQVAQELATLAGFESLEEMIGPYGLPARTKDDAPSSRDVSVSAFPNLRKCTAFFGPDRWQPWTIAAAEAGFWPNDVPPNDWPARLDKLEKTMVGAHLQR